MRQLLLSLVLVPSLSFAAADFRLPALSHIRQSASSIPSMAGATADPISMYPMTGASALVGYADSESEYQAAVARWTGVLTAAGLTPGASTFEHGVYTLAYASADGKVLRRFDADPRQFAPKDPAALTADKELMLKALADAGMTVIWAPEARFEGMLPSYYVYYLGQAAATQERETQLRVLARGDDIDFDLLEAAGVKIVSKPKEWLMVYLGPQLSFVTSLAPDLEAAQKKLDKRVEYLKGQGMTIIGTRITAEAEMPAEYRYVARVYFFL